MLVLLAATKVPVKPIHLGQQQGPNDWSRDYKVEPLDCIYIYRAFDWKKNCSQPPVKLRRLWPKSGPALQPRSLLHPSRGYESVSIPRCSVLAPNLRQQVSSQSAGFFCSWKFGIAAVVTWTHGLYVPKCHQSGILWPSAVLCPLT